MNFMIHLGVIQVESADKLAQCIFENSAFLRIERDQAKCFEWLAFEFLETEFLETKTPTFAGVLKQSHELGSSISLALTRLESWIGLADHKDLAATTNDLAVAVARFRRFERRQDFHESIPNSTELQKMGDYRTAQEGLQYKHLSFSSVAVKLPDSVPANTPPEDFVSAMSSHLEARTDLH